MSDQQEFSPGVMRYIDRAIKETEEKERYLKEVVRNWKFDTVAVHGLYTVEEAIDNNQGSIIEPIYMSTSQAYRDSDEMEAALAYQIPTWCYARIANPSTYYLEWVLALLESYGSGVDANCVSTSSGMAAVASATNPFLTREPGENMNFVSTAQVYGGTFQQFQVRYQQESNIECRWIKNSADPEEWRAAVDENTRFCYGELPSNPGQAFFDLEKVSEIAHSFEIPLIVDSTVATPALLRPLCHGADIVVQSATKSLTASGFGVAGAMIARKNISCRFLPDEIKGDFATYVKLLPNRDFGPNLSPMNAILTLNDVRTIRSKMDQLSRNTMKVANYLNDHPRVEKVQYLGLPSHRLHDLASRYMYLVDSEHDEIYQKQVNRYGHLLSFLVAGGAASTRRVFDGFQRIWRATDLGRIKSVATIPAISTHQQQGEEGRELADIPPNLIRLCVGGEHPDDVIADLDQALAKA